jgi:phosphomannomutase
MFRFIFDVDGTLTPSRSKMDPEFKDWFLKFAKQEPVFLVSGSDYPKTVEQLGEDVCHIVKRVFSCSGNDVWMEGKNIQTNKWEVPKSVMEWLSDELIRSPYPERTGNHIEIRPGCLNFSVVGRNATPEQRKRYVRYDEYNKERRGIASTFNYIFAQSNAKIIAKIGGDTGLDIYPIGKDKSQIINHFRPYDDLVFFGDKMGEGGNDKPFADVNVKGTNHHVSGWEETWEILQDYIGKL